MCFDIALIFEFLGNVGEMEEIGSLLDSIYGKKWREKQDQILPKTEYKETHKKSKINVTHSER